MTVSIQDRIKSLRRVKAKDLLPDKRNWRKHPPNQRKALRKVLDRLGWIDAAIARETPEGLVLIDGHLRVEEMDPEAKIPTLIVTLTEQEAGEAIATHDPLGGLATMDSNAVSRLLAELSAEDPADELRELMESVRLTIPDTQIESEWEGMPEFQQEAQPPFRIITMHFRSQEGLEDFEKKLGIRTPAKRRSMFYPPSEDDLVRSAHVRYESDQERD